MRIHDAVLNTEPEADPVQSAGNDAKRKINYLPHGNHREGFFFFSPPQPSTIQKTTKSHYINEIIHANNKYPFVENHAAGYR